MAIKIDIEEASLRNALDMAIASAKRAKTASKKPQFAELYEREIVDLQKAAASIQIIK